MSEAVEALRQARYVFEHRMNLSRQEKIDAAIALGEWGLFSKAQISVMCDLRRAVVNEIVEKDDHTGGKFAPESISLVLEVLALRARGEVDYVAVTKALEAGCSVRMLSRLTRMPETTVKRHAEKGGAVFIDKQGVVTHG